jgi:hypothetical protein
MRRIQLVVDRANAQVALELFERLFDLGELDIPGPELNGIVAGEVGAQQIAALTPADLAQLLAIECKGEGLGGDGFIGRGHLDAHQPIGAPGVFLGRAEFQQELVAAEGLALQLVQTFP